MPLDLAKPHSGAVGEIGQVDVLVHLAAYVPRSKAQEYDDALKCVMTNVLGTCNLLHHVGALSRRIILISTLEVYGPPESIPISESHRTNPTSYYGASKLAAEHYLSVFCERNHKSCIILRLATVYGPGEPYRRAIPNFIRNARKGEQLTVYGDGSDIRDYLFIEDAVEAIMLTIRNRATGIYNIASGTGHSIREVAERIVTISGGHSRITYRPSGGQPTTIILDTTKARKELGFSAKVGLVEGLTRTWDQRQSHP